MTKVAPKNMECAVCGGISEQFVILSTNCFGSPDLDLRPSQMQRSTMSYWVQECPHCGYVAGDIEKAEYGAITKEQIKSILSNGSLNLHSELAQVFYKKFLLGNAALKRDNRELFFDMLHAAWDCDDAKDMEGARQCRLLALNFLDEYLSETDDEEEKTNLSVCRADLLRRTGQFEKLKTEYSPNMYKEDILKKIISFQIEKANEENVGCFKVSDAAEE